MALLYGNVARRTFRYNSTIHFTSRNSKANPKQDWDRIIRCLNYLRKEGVVVVSDAPRDHYRQRFWALAERQSEFWPDGVPTQEGRHLNTRRLLALLESATEPLTCRQIVIKTTDLKGLSTKRVQMLCSRMWYCLEYHRKKGVVEKVPMPQWGKKVHGWVIVRDRTLVTIDHSARR